MKKIERPMSTTYVDELLFHYCDTVEQVKNAFANVDPKDIFIYKRWIDMDTFQPWLLVFVKNDDELMCNWYKWIVPLELGVQCDNLPFNFESPHKNVNETTTLI